MRNRIPKGGVDDQEQSTSIRKVGISRRFLRWLITFPQPPNEQNDLQNKSYHVWNSHKSIFLLGGRLRVVKGRPISILTFTLVLLPGILFSIFDASWSWHHISPGVVIVFYYLWLLTVSSLIKASTYDPGVSPKNIHLTEDPYNFPEEYHNTISLPASLKTKQVEVKYCSTCRNWRMPRTFHCSKCDQCISIHDHHCIWINNCVGERNYRFFFNFLFFACLSSVLYSTLAYYHVFKYSSINNLHIAKSLRKTPMSLFNGIFGNLLLLYPFSLLCFHVYFTLTQQTTREFLKSDRLYNSDNPYTLGNVFWNFTSVIFRQRGSSYIRTRDKYTPGDVRFDRFNQVVNA